MPIHPERRSDDPHKTGLSPIISTKNTESLGILYVKGTKQGITYLHTVSSPGVLGWSVLVGNQ